MKRDELRGSRYWLVGASEGIGAALALELDKSGVSLILSGRNANRLSELASRLQHRPQILPFDVTKDAEVADAVAKAGDPDGVIYMAGDYKPMAAQEWEVTPAIAMSDVNFTGALRIFGRVVPRMAKAGAGHVLIVGSLAGFAGLEGAIGYGSSKAAVMHLAQNLRTDLRNNGVKVQLVNPGFVETRLTRKNDFRMPFITTPEKAALQIAAHMRTRRFSRSFPGLFAWYFKLRAVWMNLRA